MRHEIMITVDSDRVPAEVLKFFQRCASSVDEKASVRLWGEGGTKRQLQSYILTELNSSESYSEREAVPRKELQSWIDMDHSLAQFYRAMSSLRKQGLVKVTLSDSSAHLYYLSREGRKRFTR